MPPFSSVDYVKRSYEKGDSQPAMVNVLENLVNLLPHDNINLHGNLLIIVFIYYNLVFSMTRNLCDQMQLFILCWNTANKLSTAL